MSTATTRKPLAVQPTNTMSATGNFSSKLRQPKVFARDAIPGSPLAEPTHSTIESSLVTTRTLATVSAPSADHAAKENVPVAGAATAVPTKKTVSATARPATAKTATTTTMGTRKAVAVPGGAKPVAGAATATTAVSSGTTASAVGLKRPASAAPAASSAGTGERPTKRAAWDIKGRLEDALEANSKLKEEVAKIAMLEAEVIRKTEAESQLEQMRSSRDTVSAELRDLQKTHVTQMEILKLELQGRVDMLSKQKNAFEVALRESEEANTNLFRSNEALKSQLKLLGTELDAARVELAATKTSLSATQEDRDRKVCRIEQLEQIVSARDLAICELEQKRQQDELLRTQLHNTIQELKGNVRVYCRIRPALSGEQDCSNSIALTDGSDHRSMEVTGAARESADGQRSELKKYQFTFDRIFGPACCQADVFVEISQLVQSALDGYRVCIFAYGQTGAGKSFTMEGSEEHPGMIPLSVDQIFATSQRLADRGWKFQFSASYLEIYNETIRDLLASSSAADEKQYDIKHDPRSSSTAVTDLTVVEVVAAGQVSQLLQRAVRQRAVASTNCNERSSRSHSVFQLHLVGDNALTGEHRDGTLNLIDLAGSERLNNSGSTGDRLKETQHINKSLSCLGDVIHALANKEKHVPFRNSKLTYLLQNALGGNCKTLMFVNVSPADESVPETINSLRFASKVNSCEIGTAKRKV